MSGPSPSLYVPFDVFDGDMFNNHPPLLLAPLANVPPIENIQSEHSVAHDANPDASPTVATSPDDVGSNGSAAILIQGLNQLMAGQVAAQERMFRMVIAGQAVGQESIAEVARTPPKSMPRPKTSAYISAGDIAKAAHSARHGGKTAYGQLWWATARSVLRRLCPEATTLLEADGLAMMIDAHPALIETNTLAYEFCVACIDQSKDEGKALMRRILQATPSLVDDGWGVRRLIMGLDAVKTTLEADAIYRELASYTVSLDADKDGALDVSARIDEKWNRLPAYRKGHSRRNSELLVDAIPVVAAEVAKDVRLTCDMLELTVKQLDSTGMATLI